MSWQTDGVTSTTKIVEKDNSKLCQVCGGYRGHFNDCKVLKKEVERGRWD